MARTVTPRTQITGKLAYWLLDLEVGGRTWRYSTSAVDVTDNDGNTIPYIEGLARVAYTAAATASSVAITISSGEDWALVAARGIDLESGTATLRRWFDGQTLEEARLVLDGLVVKPQYGDTDEPLVFSLERLPWEDTFLIPDATYAVDDNTWPSSASFTTDPAILGAYLPIIFGSPGYIGYTGGSAPITPASPGLLVDYTQSATLFRSSKLAIAGHEVRDTSVRVYDMSDDEKPNGVSEQLPVLHATDMLGRKIAYIDYSSAVQVRLREGGEYWIAWSDPATGGGLYNSDRTGVLRGAGDVILWWLDQSSLPLDRGRMKVQSARLNRFNLDCYVYEPTTAYQWIMENLAPILPISYREGADGAWFAAWRYDATPQDSVMRLDADTEFVTRESRITTSGLSDVRNEITLEYAPRQGDRLLKRMTITGDPDPDDGNQIGSYLCKLSQQRYGVQRHRLTTTVVVEDATAAAILGNLAQQLCLPRRRVTYSGPPDLEALEVGDVVTLNDAVVHITDQLALVEEIGVEDEMVSLNLLLLDSPLSRSRSTT